MSDPKPDEIAIFAAAAELAPDEQAEFLDEACQGDRALRERIQRYLQCQQQEGPLDANPLTIDATNIRPVREQPGDIIGPYKLLQQIGEGGMGVVYLADQTAPIERRVALKIIKPGMDSQQVIARFEAERQALAMMDHPNIATVLDAGTTESGRPYFVMELVKGIPITTYCDEQRLTPRERLQLLVPVCEAVQHAHQKGIIHRDLKPNNILVAQYDDKSVPKVIDFGVAKAISQKLTEKTMFTQYGQVVGTIEYMSPEQARFNQLDVDTRSDIYSLGVLLYELLTGETPFDRQRLRTAAFEEMLRILREEEPARPSIRLKTSQTLPAIAANRQTEPRRLSLLVRGELDWIVMKALEKDRGRRYETASALAGDLDAYLQDEPVMACPPSTAYKLGKFARRNKSALTTIALLVAALLLVVGSVGWTVRDRIARHEQAAREGAMRQTRVRSQVELILDDVNRRIDEQQWEQALSAARRADTAVRSGEADAATKRRVEDVLNTLQLIDRLEQARRASWRLVDGDLDRAAANSAYARAFSSFGLNVDDIHVDQWAGTLRSQPAISIRLAAALTAWARLRRKIAEETQDGVQAPQTDWQDLLDIADAIDLDPWRRRFRAALRSEETSSEDVRHLADSITLQDLPASSLVELGTLIMDRVSAAAAAEMLLRAHALYPDDFWLNVRLAGALQESQPPRLDEALVYLHMAWALQPEFAVVHNHMGLVLHDQEQFDKAIFRFRRALELAPNTAGLYTNLAHSLQKQGNINEAVACNLRALELEPELADAHNGLGLIRLDQERYDEALALFRKALECDATFAWAHNNAGIVLCRQGQTEKAIAEFEQAIALDLQSSTFQNNLGMCLEIAGRLDDAIKSYRRAVGLRPHEAQYHLDLARTLQDSNSLKDAEASFHRALELDPALADAHNGLGVIRHRQGRFDDAVNYYRKAIEIEPEYAWPHNNLGIELAKQGKMQEAIASFQRAITLDPEEAQFQTNLGLLYKKQGQHEKAVAHFRRAIEIDPNKADVAATNFVWLIVKTPDRPSAEYKYAIELAQQLVDHTPSNANYWDNLGVAQYRIGQRQSAIESLEKARRMREGRDPVHAPFLAMAYWKVDRQQQAQSILKESIALFVLQQSKNGEWRGFLEEAETLCELALTGEDRQRIALEYAEQELMKDAGNVKLRRQRVRLYFSLERWQEAASDSSEIVKLQPDDHDAYLSLARASKYLGRYDAVVDACGAALAIEPMSAHAYFHRGDALRRKGERSAAIADLEKAIELDPDFPWSYRARADIHAALGEWHKALADLQDFAARSEVTDENCKRLALLRLISGEHDAYRQQCSELAAEYEQTHDAQSGRRLLFCAILAPDAIDDPGVLIELAEAEVEQTPEDLDALLLLGAAYYRTNQIAAALEHFEAMFQRGQVDLRCRLWLSLARCRAGQEDAASAVLNEADGIIETKQDWYWVHKLQIELLRAEVVREMVEPPTVAPTVTRSPAMPGE